MLNPNTALLLDRAGNLFGGTKGKAVTGNGTVFRLSRSGTETVLHEFNGSDGAIVQDLKADANGNLYGVASQGGANGVGTVFELTAPASFRETIIPRSLVRSIGNWQDHRAAICRHLASIRCVMAFTRVFSAAQKARLTAAVRILGGLRLAMRSAFALRGGK